MADYPLSRPIPRERSERRHARRSGMMAGLADVTAVLGALARMVWQRKLWWMVPLLMSLLFLAALLFVMEATPVGPLLYPIF
jgi:fatty acid desaturase